jgi:pimeloyl-ACP methyl ester carboxylesterase
VAHLVTDDGVKLYYEETGSGLPVVFVHEFAGDYRSYEQQVRCFSRRYRCIAYNARGYPPSDVPADLAKYSQERAREDIRCVLDALKIDRAHVVGVSMGAFAALHFALAYPSRAISVVLGGCGYGAEPAKREQFAAEVEAGARRFETLSMADVAAAYAEGPGRVQLRDKDPRGYAEFVRHLAEHSPVGSAMTLRGVQMRRPSLYDLVDRMKQMTVPTLVITGDEDEPCLEPAIMMKRAISSAALITFPRTGHALNLEEPALFNSLCDQFFHQVESGRWTRRNPLAIPGRIF